LDKFEQIIKDQNELDKHLSNKAKLQKIINTFKSEINKVKNYQKGFDQRNKLNKKLIMQNPLFLNFNKFKRKSEKSENSTFIDQTTSML
jgi:hypothetical protein